MPVRSWRSSVLRWPDRATVDQAVRRWAAEAVQARPEIIRVGYFGSYARGDWGVGSDIDLVVVLERSDLPLERRGVAWDVTGLPVPADVLVYTQEEWEQLTAQGRFGATVLAEAVWVQDRGCR